MESFISIFERAAERKGGASNLEKLLVKPKSAAALADLRDAEVLAEMTRCVFRSGFVWRVIENKWPAFETAFDQFDVTTCALLSDEALEGMQRNSAIVRHASKIASVRRNAQYLLAVRAEHGSYGRFLAEWPATDFVDLWHELKLHGDRLGGQTGRYFLRFIGRDTPLLSNDVVAALQIQGVIDKAPSSQRALRTVQAAFNVWREESGRSYNEISRVLAMSVPD